MPIRFNFYAGGIVFVAILGTVFLISNFGPVNRPVEDAVAYVFLAQLFVLDLALRAYFWRKTASRLPEGVVRLGMDGRQRKWPTQVLDALFGRESGGQFFEGLPVWLLAVGIVAIMLVWNSGLLDTATTDRPH